MDSSILFVALALATYLGTGMIFLTRRPVSSYLAMITDPRHGVPPAAIFCLAFLCVVAWPTRFFNSH